MINTPLPGIDDPEGDGIPESLPLVIDAHVHLFPDELFQAIWQWFDRYAWPIRHRLKSPQIVEFLLSRGIHRIVGLHYAHRPGIARALNEYMAQLCSRYPQVIGTATVFPGEENTVAILEEAFRMGLIGVKLHAHVQGFDMDSSGMHDIYQTCVKHGQPLIMHVGREPKSPVFNYPKDPYLICSAKAVEEVIRAYPKLRVCVPHMGADEYAEYQRLLEQYDNLWLDNAMILADYFPGQDVPNLSEMRCDRIMYGTDFPHLPYAWDRELKRLCELGLKEESLALILGENAMNFFSVAKR